MPPSLMGVAAAVVSPVAACEAVLSVVSAVLPQAARLSIIAPAKTALTNFFIVLTLLTNAQYMLLGSGPHTLCTVNIQNYRLLHRNAQWRI